MKRRNQFIREVYWEFRARRRAVALRKALAHFLGLVVDVRGIQVRVHRSFSYEVVTALLVGSYESPERSLIEHALRPDDVIMEFGAGLGYISTICARVTGSERVFVYEANPRMEAIIRDTHRLNGVSPNLRICMVGLNAGTATFRISQDFIMSSALPVDSEAEEVTVPAVAFSAELKKINPTVLIADIEGGEYELCRQLPPNRCRLIMLELHPRILGETRAKEVLNSITEAGFQLAGHKRDSYLFERSV